MLQEAADTHRQTGAANAATQRTPLLITVRQAREMLSISNTTLYVLINAGKLDVTKIGRRTLIRAESIDRVVREGA